MLIVPVRMKMQTRQERIPTLIKPGLQTLKRRKGLISLINQEGKSTLTGLKLIRKQIKQNKKTRHLSLTNKK